MVVFAEAVLTSLPKSPNRLLEIFSPNLFPSSTYILLLISLTPAFCEWGRQGVVKLIVGRGHFFLPFACKVSSPTLCETQIGSIGRQNIKLERPGP